MLRKRLIIYSVLLLEVFKENIPVTFFCIDTTMMTNKDNKETREKAERTTPKSLF